MKKSYLIYILIFVLMYNFDPVELTFGEILETLN